MSSTITQTMERFALDGPIRLSLAIALGMVLLAAFAWLLWRERRIVGPRTTVLFWLLRAAALATVLWMLLAPTSVRVETSTTRKAVAVVADVSGSMGTIDPPGTSDELRWALAASAAADNGPTQSADRAVAAVAVAQRRLATAIEALRQHKPESAVVEATSLANHALERARTHLAQVQRSASSDAIAEIGTLAQRVATMLDAPEFESFDQLCAALEKGRTPSQKGWRESLPDLEHRLAGIRRPLGELARRVAEEEASRIARSTPELLTTVSKKPRLERTAAFLDQLEKSTLASLAGKADVRWTSFDQSVAELTDQGSPQQRLAPALKQDESSPSAAGTDISAVLEQLHRVRQDQPLAAVILLSDMAHNQTSGRNPREVAALLTGAPVHVVPIGNTQRVRDVVLQSVTAPAVVLRNDDIVIEASLQAFECENEVCIVQLLHEGEVIDFREAPLDSGFASRTVRFERRMPAVGVERFQIALTPLEGELTEENNYGEFEVNVTRSDIKVLLADELPRWEYRYLTQLFRRDPKVECDELLFHPRMIATGRREASKAVPTTVDDWDQYDVVILGDLAPEHLPAAAQESLIEYMKQRGGAVVLIAGREAMPQAYAGYPLEQVLPVSPVADSSPAGSSGFAFRVTEEGQEHDALMIAETEDATRTAWDFVNRVAPLHQLSAWRRPRPSAHTLIAAASRGAADEGDPAGDNAFLCWQPVGRGRVVYLAGPETYRLRFLRGDRLHYRFWGQLLRWAIASDLSAGTKFVRIRTDKSRYDMREAVQAAVELRDAQGESVAAAGLQVRVSSGDDERTVPLAATEIPGEYRAEIHALPPGVYRVEPFGPAVEELQADAEQGAAAASFTVQAVLPQELVDTRADRALAQQIADITGGQTAPPTAVAEILELTNLEPIVTESTQRRPLWVEWKYLWIVFACLQIEWIIRKWKGLS